MSSVKSANVSASLLVTETLAGDSVAGEEVVARAFESGMAVLNSTSTPPVSLHYANEITFAGSSSAEDTQTIDLSDFEDIEGIAQDAQGLRVQAMRIVTPSTNIEEVTIGPSASDGYELFGPSKSIDLPPGSTLLLVWSDELPAVEGDSSGSLATSIDLVGNGGDVIQIQILLG